MMVPLLDTSNLHISCIKSHSTCPCLSNIPFTWMHKNESNPVFIHMTSLTLHETQCGMHCIRVQDGTRPVSLMFVLFLLAQGGCTVGTVHWRTCVMEDLVARAYILQFEAAQGKQWLLLALFYTPFCYAACLLHACSERLFGSARRIEHVCLELSQLRAISYEWKHPFQIRGAICHFLCLELWPFSVILYVKWTGHFCGAMIHSMS